MTVLTDRAVDPEVRAGLAGVRLGQAFFSRALNQVRNDELASPSGLPGWSRAHVVAHVGYNARALNRLVDGAASGEVTRMYASADERAAEIDLGASLSARALRHLSDHAAIALDVAWRDLPPERWESTVVTALGREVPVSETVWMRTREVWLHAVDLRSGARLVDVPTAVAERMLGDVLRVWAGRDAAAFRLEADDTGRGYGSANGTVVRGSLAGLLGWATGRGGEALLASGEPAPPAPRWI